MNQLDCGSCWAFSTADIFQSALAIKNNKNIAIGYPTDTVSIQYLVDCDVTNNGCEGGDQYNSLSYIKERGYFYTADYYYKSYMNKKMICRDKDSRNRRYETSLRPFGYRNLNANNIKTLLSYHPVSVSISVPDCFKFFKTGILTESFCKCALKEKDGSPKL